MSNENEVPWDIRCDLCEERIHDENKGQTTEGTVICLECIMRFTVDPKKPVDFPVFQRLQPVTEKKV